MDVEKTMGFILEQQAHIAAIQSKAEERAALHAAEIARVELRLQRVDLRLRHAIRLAVQEARNERKRRRELDARFELKMDQLASSQLVTEEKLQRLVDKIDKFVDGLQHPGGNGRPQ